jgi:hypothetical protein
MKNAPLVLALVLIGMAEVRLDAYLDPGSGSMLVQLLLGGAAGAAVIIKLGWQRFRDMFRSKKPSSDADGRRSGNE